MIRRNGAGCMLAGPRLAIPGGLDTIAAGYPQQKEAIRGVREVIQHAHGQQKI